MLATHPLQQENKLKDRVDLLMRLDKAAMENIRSEFEKSDIHRDGLDMFEFVVICQQNLGCRNDGGRYVEV